MKTLPILLSFLLLILTACNDTTSAPVFVSQSYDCTVSGGLTAIETDGTSTTSPIVAHPVTLDAPASLVSIDAYPTPFFYGLTGKTDDGSVVRWTPIALIGGGTNGTVSAASVVRFQYDLSQPQIRLDILETYADGSALRTEVTGVCRPGGV